ncbi:MAG: ribonuclease T [Pseudomonadota bacterium]
MRISIFRLLAVAFLSALVACEDVSGSSTELENDAIPLGAGFDFYVLALSWSPGYCRSQGDRANREQCGQGRSFEWVVHGLWPQFNSGYPEFCEPGSQQRVPRGLAEEMLDIMPSTGLIGHQWRKHGSCTGLSQKDYFATTRRAFSLIKKPDIDSGHTQSFRRTHNDIETAFLNANSTLQPSNAGVTCDRRFLRDVRICLSKDLSAFVSCPEVDRRHCRLPEMVVVPAR